ncbi:TonB-dependent receptor [uncultured Sphingomonas sp.]|uniref:TonB-dependent receptor n=1 Tax=uncultured Sphingomonas sp. TaxID=158754 RepID=UPI002606D1D8|nr:TonB-dependent receptor [uncultured Sphingomonas sp.]
MRGFRSRGARFTFLACITAEAIGAASPALARDRKIEFTLPAADISTTLMQIAQTAGVSIGWVGRPLRITTRPVRGTMTVERALSRVLARTGFRAMRVGDATFRLVEISKEPRSPRHTPVHREPPSEPAAGTDQANDILVTGQKRSQTLPEVPGSIVVIDPIRSQPGRLSPGSRDIAESTDGLAVTNLGPGRNRQFIRGVADSPFNGSSQSTVAVVVDDARVTFDAPDPDLRLVDVARVEILKGPQGPLYGSGALGGIYHVVTRKPDLSSFSGSLRLGGETVEHGAAGGGIDGVVNLPLVPDVLAVRAVGYANREGGWVDNIGRNRDANGTTINGVRLAARWHPDNDWTLDVSAMLQDVNTRDSQYVMASDETLRRKSRIAEPADNDFKLVSATLQGRIGPLSVVAASSVVRHSISYIYDSSDASPLFGLTGPSQFSDDRGYEIENHEIRLGPAGSSRWIVGLSYMRARSENHAAIASETASRVVETSDRHVSEVAAFGEGSIPLTSSLDAVLGARLSNTVSDDEAVEEDGAASRRTAQLVLSPSAALNWRPNERTTIYARYARAVRPGGLTPAADGGPRSFHSDALDSIDTGVRWASGSGRLSGSLAGFYSTWHHVQSDALLPSGLVATQNVGVARISGIEVTASWQLTPRLAITGGGTYVDAELIRSRIGANRLDRRLPVTPDVTFRAVADYRFDMGSWKVWLNAQGNYIGPARLTFDPRLDRRMGDYAIVAAAATISRDHLILTARLDNLFDINGDSFAFGNPFSFMSGRQFTPLRPRAITVSITRNW